MLTGAIIAGGRATRLGGRPKGLEPVGGQRIIDRIATVLRAATARLVLVANDPDADAWLPGVTVVRDVHRDRGSVAGIHAALTHVHDAVIAVAWDMPFVTADFVRALADARGPSDVVAAASPESRYGLEPFATLYEPTCLAPIERAIARGDVRAVGFFADVRVQLLAPPRVEALGGPTRLFFNVNTVDDLTRAQEMAAAEPRGDRESGIGDRSV